MGMNYGWNSCASFNHHMNFRSHSSVNHTCDGVILCGWPIGWPFFLNFMWTDEVRTIYVLDWHRLQHYLLESLLRTTCKAQLRIFNSAKQKGRKTTTNIDDTTSSGSSDEEE
jgi:hypothetical protein